MRTHLACSSTGASASGNDGGGVTSLQLLEQALLLHPAMLQKLIEKTPIKEVRMGKSLVWLWSGLETCSATACTDGNVLCWVYF